MTKPRRCDDCPAWITFKKIDGQWVPWEGSAVFGHRHDCPGRPGPKSKGFRKSKGWGSVAWGRRKRPNSGWEAILTRAVYAIVVAIVIVAIFFFVSHAPRPF
jgi:hypothetical protein